MTAYCVAAQQPFLAAQQPLLQHGQQQRKLPWPARQRLQQQRWKQKEGFSGSCSGI